MSKHKYPKKQIKKITLFVYLSIILILLFNYYKLQLIDHKEYKEKGENNSLVARVLNAPRGIIFDRNGLPLVDNKFIYDINIIPNLIDQNNFNYKILNEAAGIKKEFVDSIIASTQNSIARYRPKLIKRQISFEIKSILDEYKLDLKGMYFSKFPVRTFVSNSNLSHVIGYLKGDRNGKLIPYGGIEKNYDSNLTGKNGVEYHLVNNLGVDQGVFNFENRNFSPMQGDSLFINIDSRLQSFCESLVKQYKGAVIVSDPSSGEILSMLSFPDFDLNSFAGPITEVEWKKLNNKENSVMINRATQGLYAPGSIFKLIIAAIALDKKIVDFNYPVNCNGEYPFYDTKFHCWKEEGHGRINLKQAIQQSCNVYFYDLIRKMDLNLWSSEVEKFGFGSKTAIDLNSEKKGLVPTVEFMNKTYKNSGRWSKGHELNLVIGQGETLVPPIQINNLINYIANQGHICEPRINGFGCIEKHFSDYSSSTFNLIKNSMYDAVNKDKGTAYNAAVDLSKGKVYGKTGTVQICSNCDILPHAWFAGFMETKNDKKYTITIIIENGGKGSNIPSKLAGKIFEFLISQDV